MFVGKSYKYTLEPNTWCGWEVDNKYVTIEKIGMYDIVIKCDRPNELITLKATAGKRVIEVKNILVVNFYTEVFMRRFRLDWKNIALGAVGTMALCVIPVIGDTLSSVIVGIRKKIGGSN